MTSEHQASVTEMYLHLARIAAAAESAVALRWAERARERASTPAQKLDALVIISSLLDPTDSQADARFQETLELARRCGAPRVIWLVASRRAAASAILDDATVALEALDVLSAPRSATPPWRSDSFRLLVIAAAEIYRFGRTSLALEVLRVAHELMSNPGDSNGGSQAEPPPWWSGFEGS